MSLFVRETPGPLPARRDLTDWPGIPAPTSVPTPLQDAFYGPVGAYRVAAVVAAIGLRAGVFAQLPLKGYRDDAQGVAQLVVPQPDLYANPSDNCVPAVWKIQMSLCRDVWGYALGKVTAWDGAVYPKKVTWICPDVVRPKLIDGGKIEWRVNREVVDAGDYVHVPSRWVPAERPWGICPLENSGLIELATLAQRFGRDWFERGAIPSAIVQSDKPLTTEQGDAIIDKLMARWRRRQPGVLGGGLTYTPIQVKADESQFLSTIQHIASDIAVSFNMPPTKIGAAISGSAVTYQNLEQLQQGWYVDGINPDLVVVSESLDRHTRPGVYSRWTTGAFLRSDTLTLWRAGEIAVRAGLALPDEIRSWFFELPPLPNGMGKVFPKAITTTATDLNANSDAMTGGDE